MDWFKILMVLVLGFLLYKELTRKNKISIENMSSDSFMEMTPNGVRFTQPVTFASTVTGDNMTMANIKTNQLQKASADKITIKDNLDINNTTNFNNTTSFNKPTNFNDTTIFTKDTTMQGVLNINKIDMADKKFSIQIENPNDPYLVLRNNRGGILGDTRFAMGYNNGDYGFSRNGSTLIYAQTSVATRNMSNIS
jgi:hypothetical protein